MLVVKRLYGYSYEETVERVSDSLKLWRFCRVYLIKESRPVEHGQKIWLNEVETWFVKGRHWHDGVG
jgi:hypothetical protein